MRAAIAGLCLVLVASPGFPQSSEHDERIARLYYDQAAALLAEGQREIAERTASSGLRFDPESSDLYAVFARAVIPNQRRTSDAEQALVRALSFGSFLSERELDSELALSELYLRTMRFQSALDVLNGIDPVLRESGTLPAAYYALRGRAELGLGRVGAATRTAREGLRRYPGNPQIYAVLVARDDLPDPDELAWLDRHRADSEAYRRVILGVMDLLPADRRLSDLLDIYEELFGPGPDYHARRLRRTQGREAQAGLIREIIAAGGLADLGLLRSVWGAVDEDVRSSELIPALRSFAGESRLDADRNGYYEEIVVVDENGSFERRLDADENGRAELEISVSAAGKVTELVSRRTSVPAELSYDRYPQVGSVSFTQPGARLRYHLIPRRITFERIAASEFLPEDRPLWTREPALLETAPLVDEALALRHAFRRDVETQESFRIDLIFDNRLSESLIDTDNDGRFDQILAYRDGELSIGARDLDDDGHFELVDQFASGRLVTLGYDEDADGTYEFLQSPDGQARAWDFNDDGSVDVVDLSLGVEALIEPFSETSGLLPGDQLLSVSEWREEDIE